MTAAARGRAAAWIDRGLRAASRLEVEGLERLPAVGPLIVATNHSGALGGTLGGLLLAAYLPRPIVFLATADWARVPLWGALLRRHGEILISRTSILDNRFLDQCQCVLARDVMLGVMIDGKEADRRFGLPKRGAAYLAARLGADLVPIRREPGRRGRLHVGALVPRPATVDRDTLTAATQHLAAQLFPPRS
jgi:1-acyl-sn-glycerol-3-phosphate acyltransferase